MPGRVKRWGVITWVVLVAAGGGTTVWLQTGETEPGPAGQESGLIGPEAELPPGIVSGDTVTCPQPSPTAGDGETVLVDCLVTE